MSSIFDNLDCYRLPWNYADNGISWLEPTTKCNLRCEGCYRNLENPVHKSIEQVRAELEVFRRLRKSDCMSIAGGDPLVYPHIVELVKIVREMGWKPIINTNGVALTESLLKDLKKAGVFGFTFHIDTSQKRPKVKAKSETELNPVRQQYAEMLAREGGISCSFNATVTEKTLGEIPNLVRWAGQHAKMVQTMVFILFRSPDLAGNFDFYAKGQKINSRNIYKEPEWGGERSVFSGEVMDKIREVDPFYRPAAYLNGTAHPDVPKWLLANRIVQGGETLGYATPKFLEMVQAFNHFLKGRYLSYSGPKSTSKGRSATLLSAFTDPGMRQILGRMLKRSLKNPASLFQKAYMQSLMIIQPINIGEDGAQDMCDGCPDMTVHEGKLVWSCRLEELNDYGAFLHTIPRQKSAVSSVPSI